MNGAFDTINKNAERENRTIAELSKAKDRIAQFEKQDKATIAKAALLFEYAGVAEMLSKELEDVWHHWDNAGEKLIHPLGDKRELKDLSSDAFFQLHSELFQFKILYKFHLDVLREHFPEFSSNAIIAGFPSEEEYPTVKRDLWNHGALLKERAEQLWFNPHVSGTEGL